MQGQRKSDCIQVSISNLSLLCLNYFGCKIFFFHYSETILKQFTSWRISVIHSTIIYALPQLEFFIKKYLSTIQILLLCIGRKTFSVSKVHIKTIRIITFSFAFFITCWRFQSCRNGIISSYNFGECFAQNSGVLQAYRCRTRTHEGLRKVITLTISKRYHTAKKLFTLPPWS